MDSNFQTSFIPKKPMGAHAAPAHSHVSIFSLLSIFVFILSIAAAVGVFFWVKILERQIATNQETLVKTREAFDPALIEELRRVNMRIDTAKELLDQHVAISRFFQIIEGLTLQSVRFKTFSYSLEPETIKVFMTGEAESFSAIALQSDVFNENDSITNPMISNMALDDDGKVTFDFNGDVAYSTLLYKDLIEPVVEDEVLTPVEAATSTSGTSTVNATSTEVTGSAN